MGSFASVSPASTSKRTLPRTCTSANLAGCTARSARAWTLTEAWVRQIKSRLPELPEQKKARFIEQYGLSEYDAGVLTADRDLAAFYEEVASKADPKQAANWTSGELQARLNEAGVGVSGSRGGPGNPGGPISPLPRGAD